MISLIAAMLMAAATPEASAGVAATAPAAPASSVQAAADQAAPKKAEKICWDEAPTGTRFSHRVCATREQLDQRRRDDQDWKMGMRPQPAGRP